MNRRFLSKKIVDVGYEEAYYYDFEYNDCDCDCDYCTGHLYSRDWEYYYDWLNVQKRTKTIEWLLNEEDCLLNTAKISGL